VCRRFQKDFVAIEHLFFVYMKLPIRADLAPKNYHVVISQRDYI
jgi:hypothetical protein